jgi:hypothetical protein
VKFFLIMARKVVWKGIFNRNFFLKLELNLGKIPIITPKSDLTRPFPTRRDKLGTLSKGEGLRNNRLLRTFGDKI